MFEPRKMTKQLIDFYKTSFDNSFYALNMIQEQMERLAAMSLQQTTILPEETKKAFGEWAKVYKKGYEDYKKGVDENFKRVEAFFAEAEKPEKVKTATA